MGDCFQTEKCSTVVAAFLRVTWIGVSFGVAEYSIIHTQKFEVIPSTPNRCSALTSTIGTGGFGSKSYFQFNKTCLKFIPAFFSWLRCVECMK